MASELESDGPRTVRRLARDGAGASALSLRGGPDDAFRVRVLEPVRYRDEVRVVARDAGVAWGGLSLWRAAGAFAVRAVRSKLGVRSRAEVAARVFADRYLDSFLASARVVHEG